MKELIESNHPKTLKETMKFLDKHSKQNMQRAKIVMNKSDWRKFKKMYKNRKQRDRKFKIKCFLYRITRPFKKHDDYYVVCSKCEYDFTVPWKNRDLSFPCPRCGYQTIISGKLAHLSGFIKNEQTFFDLENEIMEVRTTYKKKWNKRRYNEKHKIIRKKN